MNKDKTERIYIRTTPEEKNKIQKLAKEKGYGSLSAYLLNGATNHVVIQTDTSHLMDLTVQIRRIGSNINQVIRDINYTETFTSEQLSSIEGLLKKADFLYEKENNKIEDMQKYMKNISNTKLKKILEKRKIEVPNFLIYDNISHKIINQLMNYIELLNKKNQYEIYEGFVYEFIEEFIPESYTMEELILLSNELDRVINRIERKLLNPSNDINKENINAVVDVLNKNRK